MSTFYAEVVAAIAEGTAGKPVPVTFVEKQELLESPEPEIEISGADVFSSEVPAKTSFDRKKVLIAVGVFAVVATAAWFGMRPAVNEDGEDAASLAAAARPIAPVVAPAPVVEASTPAVAPEVKAPAPVVVQEPAPAPVQAPAPVVQAPAPAVHAQKAPAQEPARKAPNLLDRETAKGLDLLK